MLETLICTIVAIGCLSGVPDVPVGLLEVVDAAREPTLFEELNAARAKRQGTGVVPRERRMPHFVRRSPVDLRALLELAHYDVCRPYVRRGSRIAAPSFRECETHMAPRRVRRPETVLPSAVSAVR